MDGAPVFGIIGATVVVVGPLAAVGLVIVAVVDGLVRAAVVGAAVVGTVADCGLVEAVVWAGALETAGVVVDMAAGTVVGTAAVVAEVLVGG
ncbi:MAG TPA: hypothetical protein VM121_07520 [Acidimicrobiales bacterium]|nr:hypothetical protein [Acidimicrobiales bacterium]